MDRVVLLTGLLVSYGLWQGEINRQALVRLEGQVYMPKNIVVVSRFLDGTPLMGSLSTDGKELKSYNAVIAKWKGREILMPDIDVWHSATTSRHRNLVRLLANYRGITVRETGSP